MIGTGTAWYIAAVVVFLSLAVTVGAEISIEPPEAASEYARGKRLMREGDWLSAALLFEQLAGMYPESPSVPLFVFQRAKSHYHGGEFAKAVAGFSFFLSKYPDAPESPHAHYFLGNAYYRRGAVDRALRQYLIAYERSGDSQLNRQTRESIVALLESAESISVSSADFSALPAERRCPLISDVVNILLERGKASVAQDLAAGCGHIIDQTRLEAAQREGRRTGLEIGVMLPLSGELQEFGNEIYNGAAVALEMFREENRREAGIRPYDTKGYPADAARITSELSLSAIDAVIGPLTSEAALVSSARLYSSDMPLVIPAATEAGLTRLSESSFQLSPNIDLQAVRLADYATDVLAATTAAVISPTSIEHVRLAETFAQQFEQRGGRVIASEYYRPRDRDFGPIILDIKAMILGAIKDSAFYIDGRGDTVDVDGIPASVDVIFMPGRPEQIRLLLPQVRFYTLTGQYLGTDGWGDEEIYRLGDNVTRGAIFASPFLATESTEESIQFSAEYDTRYGERPGRLAKLGYDAMRLITRAAEAAITSGNLSRENIVSNLRQVREYQGASGTITFGEHRENVHMPLYRIRSEAAVPLSAEAAEEPE